MINKALALLIASLFQICFSNVVVDYVFVAGDRGMANTCAPVNVIPIDHLSLGTTVVYKLYTTNGDLLYRAQAEVPNPICLPLPEGYSSILVSACVEEGNRVRKIKPFTIYNSNNATGPQISYRVQAAPADWTGRSVNEMYVPLNSG